MIGRVPVPPPPGFATQPVPGLASRPQPAPSSQPASRPALPPSAIRAQGADEPKMPPRPAVAESRPAPLTMPSPEELGIACAKPVSHGDADWSLAYRRLQDLGAFCFQLDKLPQGGYRCTCLLPTSQPDRNHRIEAPAATEAAAVRLALDKAEQWHGQIARRQ